MFSTVAYLPTFLQMVGGASATESGLLMLPMVAGMLTSTITTGRRISATGRYKHWPIIGTALITVGLVLLSRMTADTPYAYNGTAMLVLGLGVGMVMQNLVLIVQNTAPRRDLGAATSANNYFRQIGASFGIAVFGSLFVSRLNQRMEDAPGGGVEFGGGEAGISSMTPQMLQGLPAPQREFIVDAFAGALPPIFLYAVPVALAGFALSWFITERPLATSVPDHGQDADSARPGEPGEPGEPGGPGGPGGPEDPGGSRPDHGSGAADGVRGGTSGNAGGADRTGTSEGTA